MRYTIDEYIESKIGVTKYAIELICLEEEFDRLTEGGGSCIVKRRIPGDIVRAHKVLVDNGIIASDTQIEHFAVLWGFPVEWQAQPFLPIVWLGNVHTMRYFMEKLYEGNSQLCLHFIACNYFVNSKGVPMKLPKKDPYRLQTSEISAIIDGIFD